MKKIIVDSWVKIPFVGIISWNHNNSQSAFCYAEREYKPYGYNIAYFDTSTKTLHIGKIH